MRPLQVYGIQSQRAAYEKSAQAAAPWLEKAQPHDTQNRAFRLLALGWAGARKETIESAARDLVAEQRLRFPKQPPRIRAPDSPAPQAQDSLSMAVPSVRSGRRPCLALRSDVLAHLPTHAFPFYPKTLLANLRLPAAPL